MDTKKSLFGTEIKHNKNVIQATLILEQPQVVQPSRLADNYLSKCICYIAPTPHPKIMISYLWIVLELLTPAVFLYHIVQLCWVQWFEINDLPFGRYFVYFICFGF